MDGHFNCAVNVDSDQDGELKEILQRWDEQGLSYAMNAEQLPTCTSMILNSPSPHATESLNPSFYPISHHSPSSTTLALPSTGLSPSLISPNQPNPGISQPFFGLGASSPLMDPRRGTPSSLNAMADADNLISRTSMLSEENNMVRSSWLSTFLQSLQSYPAVHSATGLSLPSSFQGNLLESSEGRKRTSSTSAHSTAMHLNADMLQTGVSSLDEILEQMSNDFINYGAAGSLQEQLSNALNASNVNQLRVGGASRSTLLGASSSIPECADSAQRTNMVTPVSSVSSDGGPEDDSSSHEDTSNPLDQADEFMTQSASTAVNNLSATATPLRSTDTNSSQACAKAETSAAPSSNDQDQLKKRAPKSARATKKPKRERGTKLAIKIQSDVEVLDDGYKWRKYGQKPVKNSPYPRSYYKCTDKHCTVKKHVERQAQEPEYVVATYEGVHNHSRPDQQLQALHSQTDQHASFQPFVPAPATPHNLSSMELLGIGSPTSLFPRDSQSMNLPSQQNITSTQTSLDSIHQGIFDSFFQGEPRTSSI